MMIDAITLITGCSILLFSILSPFLSPYSRFKTGKQPMEGKTTKPAVSIIIPARGNTEILKQNLPIFLNQEYSADFEVIVIAEKSDIATENALDMFAGEQHLYTTFIPSNSRYISKNKLAVTLGVKAAKHEWIILTEETCRPPSEHWLDAMSEHLGEEANMVLGYCNPEPETKSFYQFDHYYHSLYLLKKAQKGTAVCTNNHCVGFRKSEFISGDGYRGNLQFTSGDYGFIVNKYAEKDKTVLAIDEDCRLKEQEPTQKEWKNRHKYFISIRKFLKNFFPVKAFFIVDMLFLHLTYLSIVGSMAYSITEDNMILTGLAAFSLILNITLRILLSRKSMTFFMPGMAKWKIIPYEFSIFWHHVAHCYRYHHTEKSVFSTHKL